MEGFGQALRRQRQAAGMRQQDLVDALDRVIARSTLANVEVGRENPSARFWRAIQTHLPDWVAPLEPWFAAVHSPDGEPPFELSGNYEILKATYAYTFRDHRAPEEMIQVRHVRSLSDGNNGYGLQLGNASGNFDLDSEALWGGWIQQRQRHQEDGINTLLTRFHFDRVLRQGEEHEFAIRSWVREDDPETAATVRFTRPTREVYLSLNFLGPHPKQAWTFTKEHREDPTPEAPARPSDLLHPTPTGTFAMRIQDPELGRDFGIAWRW
ncbi:MULTISPECIES: helix-turn-helix transcriptional regulator [unclassified Luteococcus]|uniref:helix-turn-helix transcriptional regulator n=1 Tax=unclassified Luteococcus TaxID=2639923 RepID=UPI00313BF4B4